MAGGPLTSVSRPEPLAGPGEVVVEVTACGVCRTDLHLAEGDLRPMAPGVTPGHEVVGRVVQRGAGAERFEPGDRIGIPWLRHTCGSCRPCRRGAENLCLHPRFTGWHDHGGFAERALVDEAYAYALPEQFSDEEAAPLLCAGIVGYRALVRAHVPPGGRLGIYGFGASAHLAAQVAIAAGVEVHVCTRSLAARSLAHELGATWVGGAADRPPVPLDGAVLYAPAGELVPVALEALDRGGRLSIAGIHLSDIPVLRYQDHLFQERELVSVTANTRADGEEFLAIASRIGIQVETTPYGFDDVDRALLDLAEDRVRGAAVMVV
ncbi:zinc-dependent alcohol dehydrogenase family protein [Acidimicrobiia bacterium EGI L10123]|uniref:zinc-dependent alcohol dehydrogenase family protein n=1 Tax=Salinilacustrithrix flava TaxID=2957203 RepID=UPI003D7C2139|nr:zinc-dependent alcohol dehydrogenase family protein [Acidimicrobiia bacterium EGI L10123]